MFKSKSCSTYIVLEKVESEKVYTIYIHTIKVSNYKILDITVQWTWKSEDSTDKIYVLVRLKYM